MGQNVQLLDHTRRVVARAVVEGNGAYRGVVTLDEMPSSLRRTFEEYESLVNNQIFSLLDPLEDRIAALVLVARFEDGREAQVHDLQIFPSAGTLSFRA